MSNPFLTRARNRPIVIGHRGVPTLHQENSLAGFRRAIALGIDAVELDVRLTADGKAVVCHDDDLERVTGRPGTVSDMTWAELSKVRLQRHMPMGIDPTGRLVFQHYERDEPIPLLAEVLAEVGDKLLFNIELKLELPRWRPADMGAIVGAEIAAAGLANRVIVTSFDPRKLRAARRAVDGLVVGFCFDDSMLVMLTPLLNRLLPQPPAGERPGHHARQLLARIVDSNVIGRWLDTRIVGVEHTLVSQQTVDKLHALGVAIGTHTLFPIGSTTGKKLSTAAATSDEVHRLVAAGVDWIESDDPGRLLELIG